MFHHSFLQLINSTNMSIDQALTSFILSHCEFKSNSPEIATLALNGFFLVVLNFFNIKMCKSK